MRLLLDESLPRRLAQHLGDGDVDTVFDRGWSGLKNGELLRSAESDYEVFITADQNLQYQQNLTGFDIAIVVVAARSNRLQDLIPLAPEVLDAASTAEVGTVVVVRAG